MEEVGFKFSRLTLDCVKPLRQYFVNNKCRICDFTVGGTFLWRDFHRAEYAILDGALFLKVDRPVRAFAPPRGASVGRKEYDRIIEYYTRRGEPVLLASVSGAILEDVLRMFPNSKVWTNRDWSDYLYLSEDIVDLPGRKFSGQRNHINRFMREYPAWSFDCIKPENVSAARAYIEKFAREFVKDSTVYMEGNRKALEVLDNLELFEQFGGILTVDGEVVGVSIGEIMDDTMYIHSEKADTSYQGSYPMLVNQFAKQFVTEKIKYINREEDDGVDGLRISKMSYHPVELLDKYMMELT